MRRETPEPWASAMVARGLVWADQPSIRALAVEAQRVTGGTHPSLSTVHKLVHGQTAPEASTINAVADALKVDRKTVAMWAGQLRDTSRPWHPPEEADLLTQSQRDALDRLIRAIVERKAGEDGAHTAPNTQAGRAGTRTPGKTVRSRRSTRTRPEKVKSSSTEQVSDNDPVK